jgi:hypothetical protein
VKENASRQTAFLKYGFGMKKNVNPTELIFTGPTIYKTRVHR